jgi:hypothetical protein
MECTECQIGNCGNKYDCPVCFTPMKPSKQKSLVPKERFWKCPGCGHEGKEIL